MARVRRRRRVVARPSEIDGCVARASGMGGFGAWQIAGSKPSRWPIAACCGSCLGAARRRRDALPRGGASLPARAWQGRGEERGRE
jgi:hypothetical protein